MKSHILLSLFVLISCKVNAQETNEKLNVKDKIEWSLDNIANSFLEDSLFSSISIGIHYKGEDFTKHYGELDKGMNNVPTNKSIYDIGSVSKTFVGTLMAKAELEGKLSIEDDIRTHLEGEFSNLQYQNEAVKIKHLITHTSRLPTWLPIKIQDEFEEVNEDLALRISTIQNSYTKQEFLTDLENITIDTFPGFKYSYSNAGIELACYILEKVYHKPFEQLLEDNLLREINMTSTYVNLPQTALDYYVNGYGDYNNRTPDMKTNLWGGAGHVKSTLEDLMQYIKFHIDSNQVAQKSHQILFDNHPIHGNPNNKLAYAWEVSQDVDFGYFVWHHGGAFGVQNWIFIYPEEELGLSIITNQSGWHTSGKLYNVATRILNEIAKAKYASVKTETELITETLLDYIEGSTNGQPSRLKKAFHPDLNLYYVWAREFRTWSGKDYINDTKEGEPTGENGSILLIDYENDIATAKIKIDHPDYDHPYIDYLMLMKLNGKWLIIHKMFTEKQTKE